MVNYHITKKLLIKEYINNKKTILQIANGLNCCYSVLRYRLIKYNIKRRTVSEARKLSSSSCHNPERYKEHYCKELTCNNKIYYESSFLLK